jgi:hypothetical protein
MSRYTFPHNGTELAWSPFLNDPLTAGCRLSVVTLMNIYGNVLRVGARVAKYLTTDWTTGQ